MQNVKKSSIPTWVIVLAFIFFWPAGVALLFIRIGADRSATMNDGVAKAVKWVSYVLFGLAGIFLLLAFMDDSGMLFPAILFGVGGVLVHRYSSNMKKAGIRFKQYIDVIVNRGNTSIQSIADEVGVSYNVAVIDLQKMISLGYFTGAQLDPHRGTMFLVPRESVSPSIYPVQSVQGAVQQAYSTMYAAQQQSFQQQQQQAIVKACPSCGANGRLIPGQSVECEYCGTLLS